MDEVGERIQAVLLGRLDKTIDDGARLGPTSRVGKQPVLATDDKRLNRAFRAIVVEFQASIQQKAEQLGPLVAAVGHGLSQLGLGQRLLVHLVEPGAKLLQNRPTALLPSGETLFGADLVKLAFKGKEFVAEEQTYVCLSPALFARRSRQHINRLDELAPGMRPTAYQHNAGQ